MRYEFINIYRLTFPVLKMCQVLKASKSGYYKWQKRFDNKREIENKKILEQIKNIHKQSREIYGSPRITAALKAEGLIINKKRVVRLMKINNIFAKTKKIFKSSRRNKNNYLVVPNIVNRNFTTEKPNKLWLSDITYIRTSEGWLYLAAILDVYTRKIVGWSMSKDQNKELVSRALLNAIGRESINSKLILHSDQGSQYASYDYRNLCQKYGFVQSMSSRGNCYDNAMMESFFHSLKTENVYWENYKTREEAKKSIFEYIEIIYNRQRLHSGIGYKTPIEFEMLYKNS
jgi:transposase InsO family protein